MLYVVVYLFGSGNLKHFVTNKWLLILVTCYKMGISRFRGNAVSPIIRTFNRLKSRVSFFKTSSSSF